MNVTDLDDSPLETLKLRLRAFTREREWEAFHSPKNLAMALGGEAGELLEQFQWLTEDESRDPDSAKRVAIEHEIADVFIYLVMLSDRLGIDLVDAAHAKVEINAVKYPAETAKGSPEKRVREKNRKR